MRDPADLTGRAPDLPGPSHTLSGGDVLDALGTSVDGLSPEEVSARYARFGPNALPPEPLPGFLPIFLRQFASPLIYLLLAAGMISMVAGVWSDAGFIFAVLTLNALIGATQEFHAQKGAKALRVLVKTRARVIRGGEPYELDASELVPGDMVVLESGGRVPADLRLVSAFDLRVDESLLTGESLSVAKSSKDVLEAETPLGDRVNMVFAGTMTERGRAQGVVVATGLATEVGHIAQAMMTSPSEPPPLLLRMNQFTATIGIYILLMVVLLGGVAVARGAALGDIFILAVALAVSAIPEGLPVALTVALAIATRRMAKRNVIVRELVAVEALGSCTHIASDKTGTLTVNELTVSRVMLPDQEPGQGPWEVSGSGLDPEGEVFSPEGGLSELSKADINRLARVGMLCNEGFYGHMDGAWTAHGDTVDVALLVFGRKAGLVRADEEAAHPLVARIPFESERRFAATLHEAGDERLACVKGALENLLPMCSRMAAAEGDLPIDPEAVSNRAETLASAGYRVLALAEGRLPAGGGEPFGVSELTELTLVGLVGLIDPLRPGAPEAVSRCREAGITVSMITGDHPATALAIARELGMATDDSRVVSGSDLRAAADSGQEAFDRLVAQGGIFARVEPGQKLEIVQALSRQGAFVAVTGDGVNDAPALKAAHVGVAMGRGGTDVAREASDLILADDNFASIVAGVEEGRVAYGNVRKVILLLIATGAAEIVLFVLSLIAGLPLPLTAVQLLWLNLVTNGIQDVALAFEPAEGNELRRKPRPPAERVFNRLMIHRVGLVALVIGGVAFGLFHTLISAGWALDEARNALLLLMVLFENVMVFGCRAELRSAFRHSPLKNPLLLFGTLAAQLIHISAMYAPPVQSVLGVAPVTFGEWLKLLGIALTLFVAVELQKSYLRRRRRG
ncbi:MAG: cation-translocating P-type ATPase [Leptospirillia bacterium]